MANDGGQLAELAPGDAGFKVEDTIAKDMKRFEGVNDAIQKKAEKYRSAKQKGLEVHFHKELKFPTSSCVSNDLMMLNMKRTILIFLKLLHMYYCHTNL